MAEPRRPGFWAGLSNGERVRVVIGSLMVVLSLLRLAISQCDGLMIVSSVAFLAVAYFSVAPLVRDHRRRRG